MNILNIDVIDALDDRITNILELCTACVAVCPTPAIVGHADAAPEAVAAGVLDILRDGQGRLAAEAWARACCDGGQIHWRRWPSPSKRGPISCDGAIRCGEGVNGGLRLHSPRAGGLGAAWSRSERTYDAR